MTLLSMGLFLLASRGASLFVYVFLVPYFLLIDHQSIRQSLWRTSLVGIGLGTMAFHWIRPFDEILFATALLFVLAFFLSLTLVSKFSERWIQGTGQIFVPAIAWAAIALLLGRFSIGGYWLDIAMFQPLATPLIGWVGSLGITFLIVLANSAIGRTIRTRDRLSAMIAATVVALLLGCWHYTSSATLSDGSIGVALIQGNFPETWSWRQENAEGTIFETYEGLTLGVEEFSPDITIWPEYTIPLDIITYNPQLSRSISKLSEQIRGSLIVGSLIYQEETGFHTDAALLFTKGEIIDVYESGRPAFFNVNTVPGLQKALPSPTNPPFGVVICFDETNPRLFTSLARSGAEFYVSLANNQHLGSGKAIAALYGRLRAAENAKYLVRASNNGVTQIIDPFGRVASQIPVDSRTVLFSRIRATPGATIFARYGYLPLMVGLGSLSLLAIHLSRAHSRRSVNVWRTPASKSKLRS